MLSRVICKQNGLWLVTCRKRLLLWSSLFITYYYKRKFEYSINFVSARCSDGSVLELMVQLCLRNSSSIFIFFYASKITHFIALFGNYDRIEKTSTFFLKSNIRIGLRICLIWFRRWLDISRFDIFPRAIGFFYWNLSWSKKVLW